MKLNSLTSLRFFFAVFVFLSHLAFLSNSKIETLKYLYINYFEEGYLGVSFFFILSGFILTHTYAETIGTTISLKKFYIARIARIYPLHLLTFLISVPIGYKILTHTQLIPATLLNVTLLQSFVPDQIYFFAYNSPSWSISDELFFYMIFPLLITGIYKNFKLWVVVLIFAAFFLLFKFVPDSYYHRLFYVNPFFRMMDFILGIVLYKFYKSYKIAESNAAAVALQLGSILLFIVFFAFHLQVPQVYRFSVYYWLPMLLIVLSFAYNRGIVDQILSNKILVYLGEISFSFYLFHFIIIKYVTTIISKKHLPVPDLGIIAVGFFITLIVSALSFEYFEKPVNRYIKKRF